MKNYVCDFCDSLKLGMEIGIKTFKKEFKQMQYIRKIAKKDSAFKKDDMYDKLSRKQVLMVRELAQENYDEKLCETDEKPYNPTDVVQKAYREMEEK